MPESVSVNIEIKFLLRPTQTALSQTVNNPRFAKIIRRHLEFNPIAQVEPDKSFSHFSGNMRQHLALPAQIDTEHRPRQHFCDRAFRDDLLLFRHAEI